VVACCFGFLLVLLKRPRRGQSSRASGAAAQSGGTTARLLTHFRSAPSEGEICPRVRPEGRVKLVVPADG